MKGLILGAILPVLVLISLACAPQHDDVSSQLNSLKDSQQSVAIFESTLYPVLQQYCANCHGQSQNPMFAVPDVEASHNSLLQFNLVSASSPGQSRIVMKINGGHQNYSSAEALEIEAAVADWMRLLADSGGDTGVEPILLEPTFSSIHQLILLPKCASCHSPGGERSQEDYTDYDTTMQTGKVKPGDPNDSGMYQECESGEMPEDSPLLSVEELAAIRGWVSQGALNN